MARRSLRVTRPGFYLAERHGRAGVPSGRWSSGIAEITALLLSSLVYYTFNAIPRIALIV